MNKPSLTEVSKLLSYILRHQPSSIGLELSIEGWANVDDLIDRAVNSGHDIDLPTVFTVIAKSDKKRFQLSQDGRYIRAIQGHSNPRIKRSFPSIAPPSLLYHGTAERFLNSIRKKGLLPGARHYVHLSQEPRSAFDVGQRHGKPIVLTIDSLRMYNNGYEFFQSENFIWQTKIVPWSFVILQGSVAFITE